MALYAIGDLHLSLRADKPMDVFGGCWKNYMEKLEEGLKVLRDSDLCVLCGDISWGMSLDESLDDFKYIEKLPGRKIILKGNHDYWWTTMSKMKAFFEANDIRSIDILHNNCFFYENIAVCGTRGWLNDDAMSKDENAKIAARETIRLRTSLKAAATIKSPEADVTIFCFFHFPPRFGNVVCHDFISVMNEFGVKNCRYGHLHGDGHRLAVRGIKEGIDYDIVSADYLSFTPQRII